jgi:hypothetical protein
MKKGKEKREASGAVRVRQAPVMIVQSLSGGGGRMIRKLMKRLQCLVAAADEVEMDDEAFERLFVYPEAETEGEYAACVEEQGE